MKQLIAYPLLTICLLFFSTCKKDVKVNPDSGATVLPCELNTPTFIRDIGIQDTFYDVSEDLQRNIVLLGKTHLLKYDYKGSLKWSKLISWNGIPQNIIRADGEQYFVTSSTVNIKQHQPNEFYNKDAIGRDFALATYLRGRFNQDFSCSNYFNRVSKSFGDDLDILKGVDKPQNNSHCTLHKFDKDGKLLWSKSFEGNLFKGTSICRTEDDNYVLLTYKQSGLFQIIDFDDNGLFQDTVKSIIDQNAITVHKIDPSGNTIWSKTIEGVLYIGDLNTIRDFNYNWLSMAVASGNTFILTQKYLYVVDANGNLTKKMTPYSTKCSFSSANLYAFNNTIYLLGNLYFNYNTPDARSYLSSLDANGNLLQEQSLKNTFYSTANYFYTSDGLLAVSSYDISKYDMQFHKIWSSAQDQIMCGTKSCIDGLIYVSAKKGYPQLIKTDRNGFY
jgi:hypothetical protein